MRALKTACILSSVLATGNATPNDVPLKIVKPVVLSYLKATGCPGDEIDAKLVTRFSDKANNLKGYIAVVYSDIGCAGGSGTWAPTMVALRTAEGRELAPELVSVAQHRRVDELNDSNFAYLKVDAALSEPVARVHNSPRALTSVYEENGQLYATGLDYAKDDARCCPSIKTLHKITLTKKSINVGQNDSRTVYSWNFSHVRSVTDMTKSDEQSRDEPVDFERIGRFIYAFHRTGLSPAELNGKDIAAHAPPALARRAQDLAQQFDLIVRAMGRVPDAQLEATLNEAAAVSAALQEWRALKAR